MRIGIVTGQVWASKKVEQIPSGALIVVQLENDEKHVALDTLGCGIGERVLVAGDGAVTAVCQRELTAVDLVVTASLDN